MNRGTGGTVLLPLDRRVGAAVAAAASGVAIAAAAGAACGWPAGNDDIAEENGDPDADADDAGASDDVFSTDTDTLLWTLGSTFETGEGSRKAGGCSDDWPLLPESPSPWMEPGVLVAGVDAPPTAAAPAVTGVKDDISPGACCLEIDTATPACARSSAA